jgi:drug/metabolite transporter (DMT)-like permease
MAERLLVALAMGALLCLPAALLLGFRWKTVRREVDGAARRKLSRLCGGATALSLLCCALLWFFRGALALPVAGELLAVAVAGVLLTRAGPPTKGN